MSRSNYTDDPENLAMWRGQVASAIRGKRGQKLLTELAEAMDAMPAKELIANELEQDGAYCALGVVGAKRGVHLAEIDPDDPAQVSRAFDIAEQLAQEIVYINDECGHNHKRIAGKMVYSPETPAERWTRVRAWVENQINRPAVTGHVA